MSESVIHADDSNWKAEVLDSPIPVLVDFWAEWCGPCRAIAPIIEELAKEFEGKVKIVKVDVDNNHRLAGDFGIRSIPTLLVFKGGIVQDQMVGAVNKAALAARLQKHV